MIVHDSAAHKPEAQVKASFACASGLCAASFRKVIFSPGADMLARTRLLAMIALGVGIGLGFAAATWPLDTLSQLQAQEPAKKAPGTPLGGYSVLPPPEQPFRGTIGRTAKDSIKDFPQEVQAP